MQLVPRRQSKVSTRRLRQHCKVGPARDRERARHVDLAAQTAIRIRSHASRRGQAASYQLPAARAVKRHRSDTLYRLLLSIGVSR